MTTRKRTTRERTNTRSVFTRPSDAEARALLKRGACPHCFALGTFAPTQRSHVDTDEIKVVVHSCIACGWEEGRPANARELRKMNALRDGTASQDRE